MTLIPFLEAFEWLWSWAKKKPPAEPPKEKMKILVVEDNANDSLLFSEKLKYCGQDAVYAQNAEAAIALIRRNNLDVIFVDLRLTYMPGWELIPMIWRDSPHTLVVVICGLIEDLANIPKPHRLMVVMTKPVSTDDLCGLFERLKAS